MNVKDLITRLQELPQDVRVTVVDGGMVLEIAELRHYGKNDMPEDSFITIEAQAREVQS